MKTLFSFVAFTALVLTSSFTVATQKQVNAQQTAASFNYLRVHKQGQTAAVLSWSVADPQISYFVVERSYDGDFYDAVNMVACNGASVHRYDDKDLFPGVIYYRIIAVRPDGSREASPVETLRIVQRK